MEIAKDIHGLAFVAVLIETALAPRLISAPRAVRRAE